MQRHLFIFFSKQVTALISSPDADQAVEMFQSDFPEVRRHWIIGPESPARESELIEMIRECGPSIIESISLN